MPTYVLPIISSCLSNRQLVYNTSSGPRVKHITRAEIIIENEVIRTESSVKYLGIRLDARLTFTYIHTYIIGHYNPVQQVTTGIYAMNK